ncbi:alpha/beta hydrolase fold [Anaeromyxobacter sp. K]|uniref:alpha/beta hydrolase n=1 Tax=Anaeromyxobacter sp. (strain K) TaxID=447217 RepID=UPI00015F9DB7|nr:alpha/beta fold hydrolase [Anaeromyxobacter sp. K]ACG74754.1 alpha/beta hydrolase fold [Anaeromyxobacter sp. K]
MVRTSSARGDEFELPGGPDAVLLLHGLTGSTFEVLPVAERLHAAGMRCLAPRMAGHAGGPAALGEVSYTEWIAQARRDLERLAGARRTFLVGCSMGALVACALAHDHPARADGLVLLAPALELQLQGRLGALLGRLGPLRRVVIPKAAGSDVRDPEMRAANPAFPGVPLGAVAELAKLARHVDAQLPGIAAPALVIAGGHDHTVTLGGARRVARRIGSGPAALRVLPESWHLVGIDVERERCAEEAARFLEALPIPGGRRHPGAAPRRPRAAGGAKAKARAGRRRRG